MNKALLTAALATGLQAASALAADTDVSAPYDWSGFYAGGHIAQSWMDGSYNVDTVGTFGIDADALRYGALAGYNRIIDGLMVGIEADASFGAASDAFSVIGDFKIEPEATLRLRLGLPQERLLPYVTLGAALAWAKSEDVFLGEDTALHLGLAAGAGVELALTDRLALRGEYLFESFGQATYKFTNGLNDFTDRASWDEHIVRAAMVYRFGASR